MRKGQSMLEYAVLICVVVSALMIMHIYVKRAYQGRIKQEADSLGQQYSPYRTTSLTETNTITNSVTYTGGKTNASDLPPGVIPGGKTVPDGMSVTYSKTDSDLERREQVESFARD